LHNRDPYSDEITNEIQAGYYGRVLEADNPNDPRDRQGFAYPVYVVFLLAPVIHLPFHLVQTVYEDLLWVLTGISVFLWACVVHWRPTKSAFLICVVLTLGSVPFAQGIKLQQLSLLVAFLIAFSIVAVCRGYLFSAGILLAIATIKPQLTCLAVVFFLGWVIHDWRARQGLAWAFMGAMTAFFIGAQLILPGWLGKFSKAVVEYHRYTHNASLLGWIFTPFVGDLLGLMLLIASARIYWPLWGESSNSSAFGWGIALMATLTVIMVPMVAPYNQILLLPGIMLLMKDGWNIWGQNKVMRLSFVGTAIVLLWPWIASVGLFVVHGVSAEAADKNWNLPFLPTFTFPLILFAMIVFHIYKIASVHSALKVSGEAKPQ
jgi:hypothetical protein